MLTLLVGLTKCLTRAGAGVVTAAAAAGAGEAAAGAGDAAEADDADGGAAAVEFGGSCAPAAIAHSSETSKPRAANRKDAGKGWRFILELFPSCIICSEVNAPPNSV